MRNYQYLGEGRNRMVFLSPNKLYVIKVPKNMDGYLDNTREYNTWRQLPRYKWLKREHLARCKLHANSGILIMEFVDAKFPSKETIENNPWTDFVDCRQVGFNLKGKLVAYDYA